MSREADKKQRDSALQPWEVLGVSPDASEETVRARYLELVRAHSPERDPEGFRRIHRAYELLKDPMRVAQRLLDVELEVEPWSEVLEHAEQRPPRVSTQVLLSFGNSAGAENAVNGGRQGGGPDG